jgi:ATP-dependent DNA helicase RecQ
VRPLKANDPALHGINFHELEARRQFEYKKFGVMLDYASRFRKHCYRSFILSYFGEWNRKRDCGNCSRCNATKFPQNAKCEQLAISKKKVSSGEIAQASATIVALKILSCVLRAHRRLGREKIAKILAGSVDSSVQDYRSLSTYGLLSEYSIKSIVAMIDYLLAEKYIAQETGLRPSLYVTPKGEVFLKERPQIEIPGVSPRA